MTVMPPNTCNVELFPQKFLNPGEHTKRGSETPQSRKLLELHKSIGELQSAVAAIDFLDRAEKLDQWLPLVAEAGTEVLLSLTSLYSYVHAFMNHNAEFTTVPEEETLERIELLINLPSVIEESELFATVRPSISETPVVEDVVKAFRDALLNLGGVSAFGKNPGFSHVVENDVTHDAESNTPSGKSGRKNTEEPGESEKERA